MNHEGEINRLLGLLVSGTISDIGFDLINRTFKAKVASNWTNVETHELIFEDVREICLFSRVDPPAMYDSGGFLEFTDAHYSQEPQYLFTGTRPGFVSQKLSSKPNFVIDIWLDTFLLRAGIVIIDDNKFSDLLEA